MVDAVQVLQFIQDDFDLRRSLKAIGIDLNPLPNRIPRRILEIDPACGYSVKGQVFDCVADLREDDLETLTTLEDNSVDIFYSVAGFNAVVDVLRGLENVERVLKDDGIGVIAAPFSFLSDPHIAKIIDTTPGAAEVFQLRSDESSYPSIRRDYISIRKSSRIRFKGFPFRLVGARQMSAGWEPWHGHIKIGMYEKMAA